MSVLLGIDTGGTYTDAVLLDEAAGVIATAKALTTGSDLSLGIGSATDEVLGAAGIGADDVALVSLSTTLATNALVEGRWARALVLIGFERDVLARAGPADALAGDPHILVAGGHDAGGRHVAPFDAGALLSGVGGLEGDVSGFAVAGRFAVLNPEHEIAARDAILETTGRPVTCSHELSNRLDGPRRALTCLLNARLISMIYHLIDAAEGLFEARGIDAPLMVVRGDGALISAYVARVKPIETILSGPAASIVGAAYLTGTSDAVVSDIGGTTTDYAALRSGLPRLNAEGATIGGWRTMVEAVDMQTVGLGGDSEVHARPDGLDVTLGLGPRRLVPVSLLATSHGEIVHTRLDRQLKQARHNEHYGRFAVPAGARNARLPAPDRAEMSLLEQMADGQAAIDLLIAGRPGLSALNRLVARGLAAISGYTPSDAAHVLGKHASWDTDAAAKAAALFARRKSARGDPLRADAVAMSEWVFETLVWQSAACLMEAAFGEDGRLPQTFARPLMAAARQADDSRPVSIGLSMARPVVGLGASASTYYPAVAAVMGTGAVIPEHAGVANAVGAVVGNVRVFARASVSQPEQGVFQVFGAGMTERFTELDKAFAHVEGILRSRAHRKAVEAGVGEIRIRIDRKDGMASIEEQHVPVESAVTATASGRPRIAV